MSHPSLLRAVTLLFCGLFSPALAGDVTSEMIDYVAPVAPASSESELSLDRVVYPAPLVGQVVAAEPDVANVVCFTFGKDGSLYVAETFRQKKGVEDNRSHLDWVEADLAAQSVDDRRAYMKRFFPDDWQQRFATDHDRIRRLTDTDGDGAYDRSGVFMTGFNDLVDGTGAGLLEVDGDILYTCIPDVYRLRDTDGDGVADETESMSTGYGVRFAYRGHDMHGLVRGPDGKVYWSLGDRGFDVTSDEGVHYHKPDTGAVFRCNPDGSDLELFAYGLRNPQEIAFNDTGDLFTVDNNSDSGDQARLVHLMEGSDAGWRMFFQYQEDRGPWNREHMWDPYRATDDTTATQPAYILPPIVNITDGPSGFTAYPGTGFNDEFNGRFFICDFRGTPSKSGIRSFRIPEKGAHFDIADAEQPFWQVLATDCEFGPDGRFYISDWVDGWEGLGKARIYAFDDPRTSQDEKRLETAELLAGDFTSKATDELVPLLGHLDRRVRLEAQWALADRDALNAFRDVIGRGSDVAMRHATWGLGQLAARGNDDAAGILRLLVSYEIPDVRVQAARGLGWINSPSNPDTSAEPFKNKLLYQQLSRGGRDTATAAIAFGRLAAVDNMTAEIADAFLNEAQRNNGQDPAIRHALAHGLSLVGRRNPDGRDEVVLQAASTRSAEARLVAVLALRQWASPLLASFLDDADERVALEAARAIHDLDDVALLTELSQQPVSSGTSNALARRVIEANYRLRTTAGVEQLLELASDATLSGSPWRSMALAAVNDWADPPNLDRVDGRWRPLEPRPASAIQPLLAKPIVSLLDDDTMRLGAARVAGTYRLNEATLSLERFASDTDAGTDLRVTALASLASIHERHENIALTPLAKSLLEDADDAVRSQARDVLVAVAPGEAVPVLENAITDGTLREQQKAVAALGTIAQPAAHDVLARLVQNLQTGRAKPGLRLDIMNAARATGVDALAEGVTTYLTSLESNRTLTGQYEMCLQGGNVRAGRDVFFGNAAASCRRCHVVGSEGAAVGPNLSMIGKEKDRQYLLEAIIEPNKAIAKGFATRVLLLADGRLLQGIVKQETEDEITLVTATGEVIVVLVDDVDFEKGGLSGMPMDLYKNLTRTEIRDLVAYLATLKTPPTDAEAHGHEE